MYGKATALYVANVAGHITAAVLEQTLRPRSVRTGRRAPYNEYVVDFETRERAERVRRAFEGGLFGRSVHVCWATPTDCPAPEPTTTVVVVGSGSDGDLERGEQGSLLLSINIMSSPPTPVRIVRRTPLQLRVLCFTLLPFIGCIPRLQGDEGDTRTPHPSFLDYVELRAVRRRGGTTVLTVFVPFDQYLIHSHLL